MVNKPSMTWGWFRSIFTQLFCSCVPQDSSAKSSGRLLSTHGATFRAGLLLLGRSDGPILHESMGWMELQFEYLTKCTEYPCFSSAMKENTLLYDWWCKKVRQFILLGDISIMAEKLALFEIKFGDCLWGLPSTRARTQQVKSQIWFCCADIF